MATQQADIQDWLMLIRAEYYESPGLSLTKPQAQRLWGLDRAMCDALIEALVATRFLRRTPSDRYVKARA